MSGKTAKAKRKAEFREQLEKWWAKELWLVKTFRITGYTHAGTPWLLLETNNSDLRQALSLPMATDLANKLKHAIHLAQLEAERKKEGA